MSWSRAVVACLLLAALITGCLTEGESAGADDASLNLASARDGPLPIHCDGRCAVDIHVDESDMDIWTQLQVTWDGTITAGFNGTATSPNGTTLPLGRGFDAARAFVDAPGTWRLDLLGTGDATIALRGTRGHIDAGDQLPNIVTLAPAQVAFGPCDQVEQTEQGASRCLRLGNGVGNIGHGPLEVRLAPDQGALTLLGETGLVAGEFVQRIRAADGTMREQPVGAADFHVAHSHFHYDGFARFTLHPLDEAGVRGDPVGAGHKSGFCFLDWGKMQEADVPSREPGGRADQACLMPQDNGWSMGVSAGWFDFYWADLTDQYVEASQVTDGRYELVSIADPDDGLLETDETDNAASVVIDIAGDTVTVVEERAFYFLPADTRNL